MSWILFSLLSALLWGTGQILLKKGFSNLSPLWNILISTCVNIAIYVPFALLNQASLSVSIPTLLIILFISCLYMFFFYAIEKGQIAFAGTIFATYPVTTIILSTIFLHERLNLQQSFMAFLIILGGILLGYFAIDRQKKFSFRTSWIVWAVLGSITTGAGDFAAKVVLNSTPLQTYNFYYPLMYSVSFALFWLIDRKGRQFVSSPNIKKFNLTIIGVVLLTFGLLSLNYAFSLQKASLVTSVSSSYTALTVLLAYIFLREKINKKQFMALLLIIIGVIFIGIV